MKKMASSADATRLEPRKNIIIRVIRLTGFLLLIFGGLVFFDLGGIADIIGLGDDPSMKHVFGGALMFTGLIDIAFIPRFIEQVKPK